jgi:DNA mismatch repair protein MutS
MAREQSEYLAGQPLGVRPVDIAHADRHEVTVSHQGVAARSGRGIQSNDEHGGIVPQHTQGAPAHPGRLTRPRRHSYIPKVSSSERTAPPRPPATATPAMRQYLDAKRQYRDAIVFFRMGDFYEMFYEKHFATI